MPKGLIHVYTGEGKGKTTAAFGLAERAAGHGRKVLVLQFLKSGTRDSGEIVSARNSGIRVIKFNDQTTPLFDRDARPGQIRDSVKKAIAVSVGEIKSGLYDIVILDEFNTVLKCGFATMKDAREIIEARPEHLELVFTGRGAPQELMELADYVTEMRLVKHPFKNGVKARKGIEF